MSLINQLKVRQIDSAQCYPWLLGKHYARRIPSISYAFGLFSDKTMLGIITYGTPPSHPLRRGICGDSWANRVLELNRLYIETRLIPNTGSFLVSHSLRMLPTPRVIVSFADTAQNHTGYVYQAANFTYTGLSAKRTDWKIKGMEHLHGVSVADISRGRENRATYMRQTYGERFYLHPRPRKHRYVYFVGDRKQQQAMKEALRYPVLPYPKDN